MSGSIFHSDFESVFLLFFLLNTGGHAMLLTKLTIKRGYSDLVHWAISTTLILGLGYQSSVGTALSGIAQTTSLDGRGIQER